MRTSKQIQTEIEAKFGFFPPFFSPALQNPQVLENLWQQTPERLRYQSAASSI
jgi:hypothetical protein